KKQYTIPEIIDIINEALLANTEKQKFILIRRERSFTLVPADDPIQPELLPRITADELEGRGNTELVSVTFRPKSLVADDIASSIEKRLMGPFGKVSVFKQSNDLVLQDTVGNIKRIIKTIREIDNTENADTYSHPCKYVKTRTAEKMLKDLLGDPRELLRAIA